MREFHVWFLGHYGETYADSYDAVIHKLIYNQPIIDTKNLYFCDIRIITKYGYRLYIHPTVGEAFEITLGKCANTKREIKPETNILHLLLSGEFDTDDCKVVEEVL